MMNFRVIQQALIDTLGEGADGRFRVVGYRGQGHDAEDPRPERAKQQAHQPSSKTGSRRQRITIGRCDPTDNIIRDVACGRGCMSAIAAL